MGFEIQAPIVWLIIFAAMVVIELVSLGLTTIWFAGGAIVAMLASLGHVNVAVQVILFIAVSVILLILIRPWARRHFNRGRVRTNAQSLIGLNAVVLEPVNNMQAQGRVLIRGQEWAARNIREDEIIPKDAQVCVREISGVKLIVEQIGSSSSQQTGNLQG